MKKQNVVHSKEKINRLLESLAKPEKILILPHNDPDPDAIASAVALRYIFSEIIGVEAQIVYRGIIGRAENRALVRYLDHPLVLLNSAALFSKTPVVMVDTQPGAGNNPWHRAMHLVGIIDHHPLKNSIADPPAVDIRPEMGASATIIYEYFLALALKIPTNIATALFYGIKTDTRGLSRRTSQADAAAYYYLQPQVDLTALAEIERAQVPAAYFRSFSDAFKTTQLFDTVTVGHIGTMQYPDMAAELADLLIRLENVEWVICTGIYRKKLLLAVRTTGGDRDAGDVARAIVQNDGAAGGHDTMAGGQIPLKDVHPAEAINKLEQRMLNLFNLGPNTVGQALI